MKRPVFYPYKMASASAKAVAKAFNCERVYPNREFRNNFKRPIINWGNSETPAWMERWNNQLILNHPSRVKTAANKLEAFHRLSASGVSVPDYTEGSLASQWLEEGGTVLARRVLNGNSGQGIVILNKGDTLVAAPMYVKYIKKKDEYRVHVFAGQVIDVQHKRRRAGYEGGSHQIRNVGNGWVFCRDNVNAPQDVIEQSVAAVHALDLDFGAVDVIWNDKQQKAFVLEVNTAPGLEGTTLTKYADAIETFIYGGHQA